MPEQQAPVIHFLSSESKRDPETNLTVPNVISLGDADRDEKLKPFYRFINKLVDAENLIVLAGSGTSLTFNLPGGEKIAPSMGDLWNACRDSDLARFNLILNDVKYHQAAPRWADGEIKEDIELLLSLCDSYIELNCFSNQRQERVKKFLQDAKDMILLQTDFTASVPDELWESHDRFIRSLARRSPKQKRLKIFTTNYDLAFEAAASNTGMIVVDGFEFSNPSRFNPAWFNYDVVNRGQATEKGGAYLSNLFHLYKLHGSVDWLRTGTGIQKRSFSSKLSGEPVFIYPSSSKYQASYDSPYLDMVAAFRESVQKPKTALLCLGFGFNDKHINNAISMALRTNPEFMLMTVTKDPFNPNGSFNPDMRDLMARAINAGDARISLVDCAFDVLSQLLPDRHKSTPEENLFKIFEAAFAGGNK